MKIKLTLGVIVIALLAIFAAKKLPTFQNIVSGEAPQETVSAAEVPTDRVERIEIVPESTFGILMEEAGVSGSVAMALFDATKEVYDLSSIREGKSIELTFDVATDELKQLHYEINTEEEVTVSRRETTIAVGDGETTTPQTMVEWVAERKPIEYEVKVVTKSGQINESLYQSALDQDIDIRAIIELADAFQWSIDFAMDTREGDTFTFVYEERYRNGEYAMPGQIFAAKYVNAGTPFYAYYFEESEENKGFFDQDGNSAQKLFLKAPVAFKYISSGFQTGPRYVAKFKTYNPSHRAIDYAASMGTPIRAVGDGVVTSAGWNSQGYGNLTSIRHNGTYSTNYAHQSKIIVKVGQRVTQGQTIGYVGSTGFSTGPHLHYEMVKNGVKVNPLNEVLPPGEKIKEENMERFKAVIAQYQPELDQ